MTPRSAESAQLLGLVIASGLLATALSTVSVHKPTAPSVLAPSVETPKARCSIVDFGPYVANSEKLYIEDARSVTGVSAITEDVTFLEQINLIEAALGGGFGARYIAYDVPANATVSWHVRYPHPIRGFTEWAHAVDAAAGDHAGHVLYDFDHEWEMVPGVWRIDIDIDSPGSHASCGVQFTVK